MSGERGYGGYLFMAVIAGGIYLLAGIGPMFANDYAMKNCMHGALGDYIAFLVADGEVENTFRKRAQEQKVDLTGVAPEFELDQAERRDWAKASVSYDRTWTLPFTQKTYKRHFQWSFKDTR